MQRDRGEGEKYTSGDALVLGLLAHETHFC
jgi:hypothetical protein